MFGLLFFALIPFLIPIMIGLQNVHDEKEAERKIKPIAYKKAKEEGKVLYTYAHCFGWCFTDFRKQNLRLIYGDKNHRKIIDIRTHEVITDLDEEFDPYKDYETNRFDLSEQYYGIRRIQRHNGCFDQRYDLRTGENIRLTFEPDYKSNTIHLYKTICDADGSPEERLKREISFMEFVAFGGCMNKKYCFGEDFYWENPVNKYFKRNKNREVISVDIKGYYDDLRNNDRENERNKVECENKVNTNVKYIL